jgi:hypothetical protein
MINNCVNLLINGAKTLLGKKSTRDILKYLGTVTVAHLGNKYRINTPKYDPMDLKNMVYHYNINNNDQINKNSIDQAIDILNINRFIDNIAYQEKTDSDILMEGLINQITKILNDRQVISTYDNIVENNMLRQFDMDTLETSAIADNYEISSGGVYLPNESVYTSTVEGCILADAKNEYLEKRLNLGEDANVEDVNKLLNDYYDKINLTKVLEYFNN